MITVARYASMIDELEQYYETFDPQKEYLEPMQEALYERLKDAPVPVQKVAQMRLLARESDIRVFRHFPFWFQITAGRIRGTWGGLSGTVGGLYLFYRRAQDKLEAYRAYFDEDRREAFIHNWANPVGNDHHALCYDDILELGLDGLKARALENRAKQPQGREFYDSAIESLEILSTLSRRFAVQAQQMLEGETDEAVRKNLERIAQTAAEVPMRPARTFYEAIAAILFCRECVGTLEGIGISTYGHLDRLLLPYYERDLAAGRITRAEAQDLLAALFVNTAVRFNENVAPIETSTTIILGGCDAAGNTVYNAVTEMILDLEMEGRYVNVKLDCRISKKHPEIYLRKLCRLQLAGLACIAMLNDDVYIPARVAQGQAVEDVRLYVAGGCHEIVLGGSEVCTRADTWIGLPRIFMETLRQGGYDDFEQLYEKTIADVKAYHEKIVAAKNAFEEHWVEYNPMPLYSSMLRGCLEKGRDAAAGGSRYATTTLSMVAPGTFIDCLYAVKTLCYDEKKLSVAQLLEILDADFEGNEPLRQYIINRIPKYCSGSEVLDAFTSRVMHDLSQVSGQVNGRGGRYLPGFYPHESYRTLGDRMGATPDGRKRGFILSRGCSPSEFLTGITPLEMLRTMKNIDFTEFADSLALEVTLPEFGSADGETVLMSLIGEFLENAGATLQFNILDSAILRDAQEHPEQHRDLIVRVCGYSFYFILLDPAKQKEIINRALRRV